MTASPPAIPEALRCLIVEDQVMFLQLLCSMLEAMPGLTVVGTATRQADAIALCSGDDAPDLLILDLTLPDGDGLAVAQALADQAIDLLLPWREWIRAVGQAALQHLGELREG